MTYDRTNINVEKLETKIKQVLESKTLRHTKPIVNFLERKIERIVA
jgi:hypothetical protein